MIAIEVKHVRNSIEVYLLSFCPDEAKYFARWIIDVADSDKVSKSGDTQDASGLGSAHL